MRGPPGETRTAPPALTNGAVRDGILLGRRDDPSDRPNAADSQEDDADEDGGREFDWHKDADDVVVREQDPIAVYLNAKGDVVIRTRSWPDDDIWVVIGREHVARVAMAMLEVVGADPADVLGRAIE